MHYEMEEVSLTIPEPIDTIEPFLEECKYKVIEVGNEIKVNSEDLLRNTKVWVFSL
jgi:hypothetical protein